MPLPSFFRGRRKSGQTDEAEPARYTLEPYHDAAKEWNSLAHQSIVLVMGVTGAGKSYFINKLRPDSVIEGHGLRSQTKACALIETRIGATKVGVVDTPGFDDDEDSDAEILATITRFLTTQKRLNISLKGIIYLHRITDDRFSSSARRSLDILLNLCGDHALPNVALVTTMWAKVDLSIGLQRDVELTSNYWAEFVSKAHIFQYNGTQAMAETIVGQLLAEDDVVLKVQHELSDDHKRLDRTSAGRLVSSKLEDQLEQRRIVIQNLTAEIQKADRVGDKSKVAKLSKRLDQVRKKHLKQIKARDELRHRIDEETEKRIEEVDMEKKSKGEKWKSRLQVFAAVVGPLVALTVNLILPLAGVGFVSG